MFDICRVEFSKLAVEYKAVNLGQVSTILIVVFDFEFLQYFVVIVRIEPGWIKTWYVYMFIRLRYGMLMNIDRDFRISNRLGMSESRWRMPSWAIMQWWTNTLAAR